MVCGSRCIGSNGPDVFEQNKNRNGYRQKSDGDTNGNMVHMAMETIRLGT